MMPKDKDLHNQIQQLIDKRNEELLETVEVKNIIHIYEPAFDYSKPFWQRFKAFLRAENKMGRYAGAVLDYIGNPAIQTARDFVRKHILPKL